LFREQVSMMTTEISQAAQTDFPDLALSSPSLLQCAARYAASVVRIRPLLLGNWIFKGIASPTYMVRRLFGFDCVLDVSRSNMQREIFIIGEKYLEERHLLQRLLKPGMAVIDVGANVGYYLLFFKRTCGKGSAVICIEPSPENLPELRATIGRNQFPSVTVLPIAAGDMDGTVHIHAGINSGVCEGATGEYEVPIGQLDTLISDEKVDFIKIDVEGYEGCVLRGSVAILHRLHPTLFVEIHPHLLVKTTGEELLGLVESIYGKLEIYAWSPTTIWSRILGRYIIAAERQLSVVTREQLLFWCKERIPNVCWMVATGCQTEAWTDHGSALVNSEPM
jgi:FkbM family methyltransferase